MDRLVQRSLGGLVLTALLCAASSAGADAPRDIATNLRLWLDGMDVNATDTTSNGGGTNPAGGAQVSSWKDKSANGYTAGDAASYGANTRTYPTYSANTGVSFNGTSDVLEIAGNIFGTNSVTASEVLLVASTRSIASLPVLFGGGPKGYSPSNRFMLSLPWNDGNIYWDQGNTTGGRVTVNWAGTSPVLGRMYLYGLRSGTGGGAIIRDGATLGSSTTTATYSPAANHYFEIGSGENDYRRHHDGVVGEMLIYTRVLKVAERNILQSYLAAKHGNPGGAGAASKYASSAGFNYFVGGIGQESDGSVTVGTSAGLTITNGTYLGNGRYLLAGVSSLAPATGTVAADAPAGSGARSQRIWYLQQSGTSTGNVTLAFNLAQLGITASTGSTMALGYRSGTTGTFTSLATTSYSGSGTVSFTATSPQTGYYVLGTPGAPSPNIVTTLSSAVTSDSVNSSNFKAIPGARIRINVVVINSGTGSADNNATSVVIPVPANSRLYLGDVGGTGSGPVQFTQGTTPSGLSYSFGGLANTTDSLDFSNDAGTTWTYTPVTSPNLTDPAITAFRIKPSGTFGTGTAPNNPSFSLGYDVIVQ